MCKSYSRYQHFLDRLLVYYDRHDTFRIALNGVIFLYSAFLQKATAKDLMIIYPADIHSQNLNQSSTSSIASSGQAATHCSHSIQFSGRATIAFFALSISWISKTSAGQTS